MSLPKLTQLTLDGDELHFLGLLLKSWIASRSNTTMSLGMHYVTGASLWGRRLGHERIDDLDVRFNRLHAAVCRKDSDYFPAPKEP